MNYLSELREIVKGLFNWNKAHLDCLARLLLALFIVRTVNLKALAVAFTSKANIESRYKRLKRFFGKFHFDSQQLAPTVFRLFFAEHARVYLTIDRTNWFWGKAKINILMLGIAYEGLAIPLY